MLEQNRKTLQSIDERLTKIEGYFSQLLELLGNHLSAKTMEEELIELRKELECLTEERTIFNKK